MALHAYLDRIAKYTTSDQRPYSYLIFTSPPGVYPKMYFARNGLTGDIKFSGTNASTVIQSALNDLTPGRTWKEKVLIKGDFSTLPSDINIPSYTVVEVQGKIDHNKLKPVTGAVKVDLVNIMDEWKEIVVPTNGGWAASNVGSGGASFAPFFLYVYTGTAASSRGMAYALTFGLNSGTIARNSIDWTKRLELEFTMSRLNSDAECIARVQLKESNSEGQLAQMGVGLQISNYNVVGESYGTSRGTVALGTLSDDRVWHVKIVKASDEVQFWVNDVLVGRLGGAYVPNVAGNLSAFFVVSIINGTTGGVNAYLFVSNIKIRQEW